MKRLLNLIENNIERRLLQYNKNVVECTKKETIRDVYIDGGVYKETKIDLIFLIDTGDWFNKTIRFDIAINTHDNMLVVRKGYGYDYIAYKRNKFKKVVEYIDYEIYKFIIDNINDSTKKINNKIIC